MTTKEQLALAIEKDKVALAVAEGRCHLCTTQAGNGATIVILAPDNDIPQMRVHTMWRRFPPSLADADEVRIKVEMLTGARISNEYFDSRKGVRQ